MARHTHVWLSLLLGFGLLIPGAECVPGIPTPGGEQDRSDFSVFTFEQSPALGFCPDLEAPYKATIRRLDDGWYRLEMSLVEKGQRGVDTCVNDSGDEYWLGADCFVVRQLPARDLTAGEVQRVLDVFNEVGITGKFVPSICVDPCRVNTFTWDDFSINDGLVGCIEGWQEYLDQAEQTEIVNLLNDLGGGQ